MANLLVILGHPDPKSLCGSLADAYAIAARGAAHNVQELRLAELDFDPILHHGYREIQTLEPDLSRAQELILWSDHIAIVFPLWWGSVPALCKGFVDRVFLPGFAFHFKQNSSAVEKLLTGRSADLVITMGAPSWVTRFILGDPAVKMLKKGLLGFCGIAPVRVRRFDRIEERSQEERESWIASMEELVRRLPRPKAKKLRRCRPEMVTSEEPSESKC